MSIPPIPVISFPCVRATSESFSFYYLDDAGVPISKSGKTITAEFALEAGGSVVWTVVPTWDDVTGLITLTFTSAMTDVAPGDYYSDIHVASSTSDDLVILRARVSITPSYP